MMNCLLKDPNPSCISHDIVAPENLENFEPYFYAKKQGADVLTKGLNFYALGHKVQYGSKDKPDGVYAEWSWDGERLSVRNDRYGFYPLFYYCRNNEICVSPSILRLVEEGAPAELDYQALSVFLRMGFFIGDDTPFKAIRAIPPDVHFEWQNGRLQVTGGYVCRKTEHISRDEAIDNYIALFRQSIRRRLPKDENFAIPLSGGQDSRHILLELLEAGYYPKICVTARPYPPSSYEDARIAAQLASVLQVKHLIVEQNASHFRSHFRTNVMTNFCTDVHVWFLVVADYLRNRVNTVYDGIGGDVLSAGLFLTEEDLLLYDSARLSELAEKTMRKWEPTLGGDTSLKYLLRPSQLQELSRELAVHLLSEEFTKHAQMGNPVSSFYFWNRTRRQIALNPYCLLNRASTVHSPYIDHDLYDFLASLPVSLVIDHQFHTDAIRRAFPRYAGVSYEDKNAPAVDSPDHHAVYTREVARFSLVNATRRWRMMRAHYLLPRFIKCLISQSYAKSFWWLAPPLIVYLYQLEMVQDGRLNELRSALGEVAILGQVDGSGDLQKQ